jgi:hypothetical protein
MPKTYTHAIDNYEVDSRSLLKILYIVNDFKGKMVGEACWSNPNTDAEEGDENTGTKFQWNDQQVMSVENM